jgi:antibiotic biosynthesis monooxygenase (ABM) superfamily enzyme
MKDARFFLMVRFTVEPQALAQVLAWLDGGHMAEVAGQPGFLWCKRVRLDGGGFVMIYGIESRAAFDAYEANAELKARFARERAPFEKFMRIERITGEVEAAHAA